MFKFLAQQSGLHIVLCVNNSMNENELIESAKKQSVKLYPLSPYDFVNDLRKESYVLLGFGSIPEVKIETLAGSLKDAWFPSCKETC